MRIFEREGERVEISLWGLEARSNCRWLSWSVGVCGEGRLLSSLGWV